MNYLSQIGSNAKKAFNKLQKCDHKNIKKVLNTYNKQIFKNKNFIIRENNKDVKNVKRKHLVDRLILNEKRIDSIRNSISEIIKFSNPIGKILEEWSRPNKLKIKSEYEHLLT